MSKNTLLSFAFVLFISTAFGQTVSEVPPPPPVNNDDSVYGTLEKEAEFPGGLTAWRVYLEKNLKGDIPARKKAPAGTYPVIVKFIVGKDGSIYDIVAETSFGYGMEQEVIRVIKHGPKWIPAIQNNKKVNAYRRQPITFVVTEK